MSMVKLRYNKQLPAHTHGRYIGDMYTLVMHTYDIIIDDKYTLPM